VTYWNDI